MSVPKKGYLAEFAVGATPTVVAKAKNVELDAGAGEMDATTRSSAGWKEFLQGLREWGITHDQVWVPDDAAMELLEAAYRAGTAIAVSLLDETSGDGWTGSAIVTNMKRTEPIDNVIQISFTLKGSGALVRVDPA